jgi:hypothetical protein
MAIAFMVQDRQKHETASDLRAIALTDKPEALVQALVKVHAIARLPRRWDADLERQMSHPSLKRRIQDIRAAAGTPPAALGAAAVLESADGAMRVIFDDESLEWSEGASASHRLRYDRLSELRIAAAQTGKTSVVACDRTGHRLEMPVRVEDVPRLQALLDIIDARVGVGVGAPATSMQPVLLRAATFAVCIVSMNAGLLAVAMVLGVALWRPDVPLIAAAGFAAIAGAVLAWRDPAAGFDFVPSGYGVTFAAVMLVGGALLVWLAYGRRREEVPPRAWKLVAVLAAASLAAWLLPIMGRGTDALGVHQVAREWPSTVVFPVALAGAIVWSARKALRVVAATAIVAAVIAAGVGSQAFLDRFGADLFLLPAGAEVKIRTLDRPRREISVPFGLSDLRVSPDGRSIAAATWGQHNRTRIHIGRAGETLTPFDAEGALFIDDDRALVWNVDGTRTDLREVFVSEPEREGWRLQVNGLTASTLSLDAKSKRWRLTSQAGVTVVETRDGVVGTDHVNDYEWSVPAGRASILMPIAVSGDRALLLEPRPDLAAPLTDPLGTLVFVLANAPRWRSTLWALGPDGSSDLGTSRLEVECHPLSVDGHGACQIFDGSRTRFFTMDASTRGITAMASLPGRFFGGKDSQGGWTTGWYQSNLIAVRLEPAAAVRVVGPNDARPQLLALSERAVAAVWHQVAPTSGIRVEPIQEATGTSVIRIYPIE